MVTDMRLCQTYKSAKCLTNSQHYMIRRCALTPHFIKFAFCQICAAIFGNQSFQHTPLNILVNFESGVPLFRGVLCRFAWNSAIHLFIIWFTDILAYLDIHVLHSDCIKEYFYYLWWTNAAVKLPLSRPPKYFDARERDYIVFQTGKSGRAIFPRVHCLFPGFIYLPPSVLMRPQIKRKQIIFQISFSL